MSSDNSRGNHKFPKPSQAMTVMPQKDKMAANVGGSAAHMSQGDVPNDDAGIKYSGGGKSSKMPKGRGKKGY